jgi:hypothetical protein
MAGKELTYELDEQEPKGSEIVGHISVPREYKHVKTCCLPITAAALAEIESEALKAKTKREVEELRVKLLVQLMKTMVAAISNGHADQP